MNLDDFNQEVIKILTKHIPNFLIKEVEIILNKMSNIERDYILTSYYNTFLSKRTRGIIAEKANIIELLELLDGWVWNIIKKEKDTTGETWWTITLI